MRPCESMVTAVDDGHCAESMEAGPRTAQGSAAGSMVTAADGIKPRQRHMDRRIVEQIWDILKSETIFTLTENR